MKTSEFIKKFNKLVAPIYIAERKVNEKDGRSVVINCADYSGKTVTKACLIEGGKVWDIGGLFGAEMLELMAELAKTPPEEREDAQQKYVILNSDYQFFNHWYYFKIGDKTEYLRLYCTDDPKDLIRGSYTLEELEKEKRWLPEKWRGAINSMLTPLDVALKKKKNPAAVRNHEAKMKHDDLD